MPIDPDDFDARPALSRRGLFKQRGLAGAAAVVSPVPVETSGAAPTSYGLYSFTISPLALALTGGGGPENLTLGGTPGSILPAGTIIFAYGTGSDNKEYTTAFTNAGVTATPFAVAAVPEPATIVSLAIGVATMAPLAVWRLYRRRRRRLLELE